MNIICQIEKGLLAIHNHGELHCNFKPTNLMLSERDGSIQVRLMDYKCCPIIDIQH